MITKNNRVLVTGGSGLIGSVLVEELLKRGYIVGLVDAYLNFADNDPYYKHCTRVRKKHFRQPTVEYRVDIRKKRSLKKAFEDFKPNYVIHLAAISITNVSPKHTSKLIPINLLGTYNVLEAFENSSATKIIYTSSSMAYGRFKQIPQPEEGVLEPINTYGATKAAGEHFVKLSKKEWIIIRPTSVYGFADCGNRVTQILFDAVHGRRNSWVSKDEKLDFTYVKDTVDGFIKALESQKAVYNTYNISKGETRLIKDFADILKGYYPKFEFEVRDPVIKTPLIGALDIRKARRDLKFNPKYSIEEGIEEIVALIKKYDFYNF